MVMAVRGEMSGGGRVGADGVNSGGDVLACLLMMVVRVVRFRR